MCKPLLFITISFIILIHAPRICAQTVFKTTLLNGTAKVQRSEKKNWDDLALGDQVQDNDIIETFFQTKAIFQFGADNVLILGSNTRALLNIKEVDEGKFKLLDVNVTLFSGGSLVKIVSNSRASIYTSNAVAQIDSGTISTVVEIKTGHTGFQMLGGTSEVRNVAQQQGNKLSSGLTTIVLPGKEPTAPLYITYRHIAVLKHFFGDDYIQQQIDEAGIQPTEETTTSRLSLTREETMNRTGTEGQIDKNVFSHSKIWGAILTDLEQKRKLYTPFGRPSRQHATRGEIAFNSSIGIAGGAVFPGFSLTPSFYLKKFSLGIRLPLTKYADGSMKVNVTSFAGFLNLFDHLTIGNSDSLKYFKLGPLEHYTVSQGLIVNDFRNKNRYTATQPLGIVTKICTDAITADLFIADLSNWYTGGFHFEGYPGSALLGFGYYYDATQLRPTLTSKNSRFIRVEAYEDAAAVYSPFADYASNTHIYEINAGFNHVFSNDLYLKLLFQFARKFTRSMGKGYVFRGPEMSLEMDNLTFGLTYLQENGAILNGHFSSMYMTNRNRIYALSGDTVYYVTQNMLSEKRKAYGLAGFFRMTPRKGFAVSVEIRHDIASVFDTAQISNPPGFLNPRSNNFDLALSVSINEELFKPIRYASLYANQIHGAYFPENGTYFNSWGFEAGLEVLTAPLFLNFAFNAGVVFTYLDLFDEQGTYGALNDRIDPGDNCIEIRAGLTWGFK